MEIIGVTTRTEITVSGRLISADVRNVPHSRRDDTYRPDRFTIKYHQWSPGRPWVFMVDLHGPKIKADGNDSMHDGHEHYSIFDEPVIPAWLADLISTYRPEVNSTTEKG